MKRAPLLERSHGVSASSKRLTAVHCFSMKISEMDVRLQAKLLRALQERVIDRVGGTRPVPVNIRILATSNRDLAESVRQGQFREDLLFRLNVVNLKLPALRERPADIMELAQFFIKHYAEANGVPQRPLSVEARQALMSNPWQGNVRELENTMHRAILLASGPEIGVEAIRMPDGSPLSVSRGPAQRAAETAEAVTRSFVGRTVADVERDLILGHARPLPGQPDACSENTGNLNSHAAQ